MKGFLDSSTPPMLIVTGLLFIIMIISGIWLSRSVQPYHVGILNFHKLVSLVVIVLMAFIFYPIQKEMEKSQIENLVIILTAVFFLLGLVSGGLLSVEKPIGDFLVPLHRILALLIVISSGFTFYYFWIKG